MNETWSPVVGGIEWASESLALPTATVWRRNIGFAQKNMGDGCGSANPVLRLAIAHPVARCATTVMAISRSSCSEWPSTGRSITRSRHFVAARTVAGRQSITSSVRRRPEKNNAPARIAAAGILRSPRNHRGIGAEP